MYKFDLSLQVHNKQEMSLKKTNGVGLKNGKKYLYINLTQMTENLE